MDILALCEPRVFCADSELNIEGYSLFCADYQQSKYGCILQTKHQLQPIDSNLKKWHRATNKCIGHCKHLFHLLST